MLFEDDEPAVENHRRHPWCRACVRGTAVTLNDWSPSLIRGGPAALGLTPLTDRGVTLADLFATGEHPDEELLVRFVPGTRTAAADRALIAWAATVGYRRVWLPDRVVTLDIAAAPLGWAATTCPTCGMGWRDGTAEFWETVRGMGAFPARCRACGGSLPEWRVETEAAAPSDRAALTTEE